jgi:hypothetical protein
VLYNNKTEGVSTAILSLYTKNGICLVFIGHIKVRRVHFADFAIKWIDRLIHVDSDTGDHDFRFIPSSPGPFTLRAGGCG